MGTSADGERGAPVEELAAAHGAEAWRLAVVAGADLGAATRAALHAVVIGAVKGGAAAERTAILALTRTWATSNPGAGSRPAGSDPVASAFWSLPEHLRSALWCRDSLGLDAPDLERVVAGAGPRAAAVARGRLRRTVCGQRQSTDVAGCRPVADVLGTVLAGHATAGNAALVRGHAAGCQACAELLEALLHPASAVGAGLPVPPDLVGPARRAWRDHVGAPRRDLAGSGRRAAAALGRRHRPVAAALAVATAGAFGAATSQLASSHEAPLPAPVAVGALRPAARPVPSTAVVRRQAVIPPLAGEVFVEPGLALLVTRDLGEVTPPTLPPAPPAPAPVAASPAPAPALVGEPPPAVDLSTTLDALPLPLPLPVSIELGPSCSTITVGFIRLALPCGR